MEGETAMQILDKSISGRGRRPLNGRSVPWNCKEAMVGGVERADVKLGNHEPSQALYWIHCVHWHEQGIG